MDNIIVVNTSSNKKNRNIVFDLLKLFAIFLVLWGHVIQQFTLLPGAENTMFRIIYSFHMPLFMMISGYFATSLLKKRFWEMVKKKFRQLIVPAVVGGMLVCGLLFFLEAKFHFTDMPKSFIGAFWFLKSAFVCSVMYWIGVKVSPKYKWVGLIVLLIISQFILIYNIRFMFPAFLCGVWLRENYNLIQRYCKEITMVAGCVWGVLLSFLTPETFYHIGGV